MQATFRGATKIEATHEVANFNPLDYQNTNHGWRSNDVAGKIKSKFAIIHFQIRKLRCNLRKRNIVIGKGGKAVVGMVGMVGNGSRVTYPRGVGR